MLASRMLTGFTTHTSRVPLTLQAGSVVNDINSEIERLEEALKDKNLSEFDRNALLAQLKAAKVRLALEEQRRRRAADRKAQIRRGNQELLAKLNTKIASEEVQQALSKEADALLAKSVVDDAQGIDTEAAQVCDWPT